MKFPEKTTVLVLGAGPAGLSIGHELSRRGIEVLILEKGTVAGESFSHYPERIFFGPWCNNTLPGSQVGWSWKLRRSTQPAYTWYLGEYARHNRLPIHYECQALEVHKTADGFRVLTSQGTIFCRFLVNCTGYFSTPNVPSYPGQDQSAIAFLHSSEYREVGDLTAKLLGHEGGRVLVVGAGLTAGETMVELHSFGYEVSLSHRAPLVFGPSPWMEAVLSPWNWVLENLAVALGIRRNSNPPMAGGPARRLICSGQVRLFPAISRFEEREAVFVDGRVQELDAVLFATGYAYTVSHLAKVLPQGSLRIHQMESSHVPGLLFLGLDQQKTYRSRFLRGIRADALELGRVLEDRLREESSAFRPENSVEPTFEVDLEQLPRLVSVGA